MNFGEVVVAPDEDRAVKAGLSRTARTADERLRGRWSEVRVITYFSYRTVRRTGAKPPGFLARGLAVGTPGSTLASVFDLVLSLTREGTIIAESALTTRGVAVIVY